MHIAYDYEIFSMQTFGGVSRYFCELASAVDSTEGCSCTIVAGLHRNAYLSTVTCDLLGIPFFPKRSLRTTRTVANQLLNKIWFSRHKPDVVHQTYYSGVRRGAVQSAVAVTVHDMIHEKFPQFFSKYSRTASRKVRAIRSADAVICVSQTTKRDLLEFLNVDPSKVYVVYHGTSLASRPTSAEGAEALGGSPPFLLYVGPRRGHKNWSSLITALGEAKELSSTFDLICFGGPIFGRSELAAIRRALPRTAVRYATGNDAELAKLYSQAAGLVYPSIYEGFGLPPLEAMAHGCPVICSNSSSLLEMYAGAAHFFDPHDPASIAEAIASVVWSRERTAALRKAGLQKAQSLSWEKCARETLKVYECISPSAREHH
jgi:glycosyltransferase involved in cell wall biosynthesis